MADIMGLLDMGGETDYGKILQLAETYADAQLDASGTVFTTVPDYTADAGNIFSFFSNIGNVFRGWFAPGVAGNYSGMIDDINNTLSDANSILTQGLDGRVYDYSTTLSDGSHPFETAQNWSNIYDLAYNIFSDVILPIAGVVLAFVLCYQIYDLVCERNNMNDIGAGTFIQLILKMALAVIVVANAWVLSEWLFDLGRYIVNNAIAVTGTTMGEVSGGLADYGFEERKWIMYYFVFTNLSLGFGDILLLIMQSWLLSIAMSVMAIIITVIIYVRLIEIYVYCMVSPIPLATLTNREWSSIGRNFIQSAAALAFQALIIFLSLAIFSVLVGGIFTSTLDYSNLVATVWGIMGYTIILVFCLFKSGSLSKSIFNSR